MKREEKLLLAKTKATFSVTQKLIQNGAHQLCEKIAHAEFVPSAMKELAESDQAAFQIFADKCVKAKRTDHLMVIVRDTLIPQIGKLEDEKAKIDNTISALNDSFNLGFIDGNYAGAQMSTTTFYEVLAGLDHRAEAEEEEDDMDL